jgi:6-phosphogluconolactonase
VEQNLCIPDGRTRRYADRNLTSLQEILLVQVPLPLPASQVFAMPVEADDLLAGAVRYAETLQRVCDSPPVFDLIHLGLGSDGHTASLVPGDPALRVKDRDTAATGVYHNRRRMTLTYPLINRARRILWLVTRTAKAAVLERLQQGDETMPAALIERQRAEVYADQDAGGSRSSAVSTL